jgi:transposase
MGAPALSKLVLAQMNRIEHLELMVAKLQRQHFGPKSEKAPINADQLMLSLSGTVIEAQPVVQVPPQASEDKTTRPPRKSRALPANLPREVRTHFPAHTTCPCCNGELRKFGEDVSEMLEYTPASLFVIRHVRPKMSCRKCSTVVQAPAPERVLDRGLPGPGLLAHVITAKYCDHTPLHRQSQIFAREGVDLDRSILARWVGEAAALLEPVAEVLRRYVLDTEKLHGDDTPLPVLAPGTGKTKTGRFWTYVRDNRPAGDNRAPAVWFAYSPDRKGEHPQRHLAKFEGILQADAFAGYVACAVMLRMEVARKRRTRFRGGGLHIILATLTTISRTPSTWHYFAKGCAADFLQPRSAQVPSPSCPCRPLRRCSSCPEKHGRARLGSC